MPQEYVLRDVQGGINCSPLTNSYLNVCLRRPGQGWEVSQLYLVGTRHPCSCWVNEPRQRRREGLSLWQEVGGYQISRTSKTLEGKEGELVEILKDVRGP